MLRPTQPQRFLTRAILVAVAMTVVLPSIAQASTTTLSNVSEYAGGSEYEFSALNTATYGEVITVPAGQHQLRGFTFYLEEPPALIFRPYVFKWNGTQAVGSALYEGPNLHTEGESAGVYAPVHAATPGVQVEEGEQYVIFFSVSKNKAEDQGSGLEGGWATVASEALGSGVYINNGYQPYRWTEPTSGPVSPEEEAEDDFPVWDHVGGASFEMQLEYGEEPPVVTAVSPATVTVGTTVTITGSEFNDANKVYFGSTPASSFTIVNDGQITVVAPPGPSGTVDVTVADKAGTSAISPADRVTYAAPAPSPAPSPSASVAHARPTIAIKLVRGTVKKGKAKVELECTGAACHGKLSLAWVHRGVTTLFSRVGYALSTGQSRTFTVALTHEALIRLKRHGHLDVRVRASVEGGAAAHRFTPLKLG